MTALKPVVFSVCKIENTCDDGLTDEVLPPYKTEHNIVEGEVC